MFNSEKGSMPMVVIIAITTALMIFVLSNLLTAESIGNQKANDTFKNDLYAPKSALEATVNVVLQKLNEGETKYQPTTTFPITNTDIQNIQTALNSSILPYISPGSTVVLTNLYYDKSLNMLCREVMNQNPYTYQQEVSGIDCDATSFYMQFDVALTTRKSTYRLQMKFDKLYPQESSRSGYIIINYDNVKIDYSAISM